LRVRHDARGRALDALAAAEQAPRPHVVVGHSLGSVIAYDVLKNVDEAPVCDGLVTLGSPLGLDEVRDRLDPGWSRWDGFPAAKVDRSWVNVFDRLDPVCGFDPVLANDYRREGRPVVSDVDEPNWGIWRHSIGKYFRGSRLRKSLVALLDFA
jgi:pimeloyl-ACP methyl ester carboxylesterase